MPFDLKASLVNSAKQFKNQPKPLLDRLEQSQSEQIAKANVVASLVASADLAEDNRSLQARKLPAPPAIKPRTSAGSRDHIYAVSASVERSRLDRINHLS